MAASTAGIASSLVILASALGVFFPMRLAGVAVADRARVHNATSTALVRGVAWPAKIGRVLLRLADEVEKELGLADGWVDEADVDG